MSREDRAAEERELPHPDSQGLASEGKPMMTQQEDSLKGAAGAVGEGAGVQDLE